MNEDKTEIEMSDEDKMHETIKNQIEEPDRTGPGRIKRSDIWTVQNTLRRIQRQLVQGYVFDTEQLTAMVNTMFGFINGVVKPIDDAEERSSEEFIEEITK